MGKGLAKNRGKAKKGLRFSDPNSQKLSQKTVKNR